MTPVFNTKLGEFDAEEDKLISFPFGLIGFPQYRKFLLHQEKGPFLWLLSTEDARMGLPLIDPRQVKPGYAPVMPPGGLEILQARTPEEIVYLTVVVVPERVEEIRTNLAAPIALNPEKRLGIQLVVPDADLPTHYPLYDKLQARRPADASRSQG